MVSGKPKIYLIHGFVGAGKTTFAKKLERDTGAVRFSPDEWMCILYGENPPQSEYTEYDRRIKEVIKKIAISLVKSGNSVIFDFGFWTRQGRDKYREFVLSIGAEPVFYALNCPVDVMRSRVKKRTSDMPDGAVFVDDNAFDKFLTMFEPIDLGQENAVIIDTSI